MTSFNRNCINVYFSLHNCLSVNKADNRYNSEMTYKDVLSVVTAFNIKLNYNTFSFICNAIKCLKTLNYT